MIKKAFQRSYVRIPVILTLVAAFSALLVGLVHSVTHGIIEEQRLAAQREAVRLVFGEDADSTERAGEISNTNMIDFVHNVTLEGAPVGTAIGATTLNAHGSISLVVGINEGGLVGVAEVHIAQSPGFGARATVFIEELNENPGLTFADISGFTPATSMAGATNTRNTIIELIEASFIEYMGEALSDFDMGILRIFGDGMETTNAITATNVIINPDVIEVAYNVTDPRLTGNAANRGQAIIGTRTSGHDYTDITVMVGIRQNFLMGIFPLEVNQTENTMVSSVMTWIDDLNAEITANASAFSSVNFRSELTVAAEHGAGATDGKNNIVNIIGYAFEQYNQTIPSEPEALQPVEDLSTADWNRVEGMFTQAHRNNSVIFADPNTHRGYHPNDEIYLEYIVEVLDAAGTFLGTVIFIEAHNNPSGGWGHGSRIAIGFGSSIQYRLGSPESLTIVGFEIINISQSTGNQGVQGMPTGSSHIGRITAWLNEISAAVNAGFGGRDVTGAELFGTDIGVTGSVAGSTRGSELFLAAFRLAYAQATDIYETRSFGMTAQEAIIVRGFFPNVNFANSVVSSPNTRLVGESDGLPHDLDVLYLDASVTVLDNSNQILGTVLFMRSQQHQNTAPPGNMWNGGSEFAIAFGNELRNSHEVIGLEIIQLGQTNTGNNSHNYPRVMAWLEDIKDAINDGPVTASELFGPEGSVDSTGGSTRGKSLFIYAFRLAYEKTVELFEDFFMTLTENQKEMVEDFFADVNFNNSVVSTDRTRHADPHGIEFGFLYLDRIVTVKNSSNQILGTVVFMRSYQHHNTNNPVGPEHSWNGGSEFAIAFGNELRNSHEVIGLEIISLGQTNTGGNSHQYPRVMAWLNEFKDEIASDYSFTAYELFNNFTLPGQIHPEDHTAGSTRGANLFMTAFRLAHETTVAIFAAE